MRSLLLVLMLLSPGLQAQTCYWVAGSLVCAGGSVCFQVGNAWICQ